MYTAKRREPMVEGWREHWATHPEELKAKMAMMQSCGQPVRMDLAARDRALILHFTKVEGLGTSEVALLMGCHPGKVRRAKRALRQGLVGMDGQYLPEAVEYDNGKAITRRWQVERQSAKNLAQQGYISR